MTAGEDVGGLYAGAAAAMRAGDGRQAAALLERAVACGRDDAQTLLQLAGAYRLAGELSRALDAARRANRRAPDDFLTLLLLGSLLDANGSPDLAGRTYRTALRHAPGEAVLPPPLRRQLAHARARVESDAAWQRSIFRWGEDGELSGASEEERHHILGFRDSLLATARAEPDRPSEFRIPDLGERAFYDPDAFGGVRELAAATGTILAEFHALVEAAGLEPFADGVGTAGRWSMIPLIRDGAVFDEFARRCPATMRLYEAVDSPDIARISPSLYFSVLEPHARIEPHTGISNARLIVHWPLIVPDGCGLRVGDETRAWRVGEPVVFDDMVEHEAFNNSDRVRVVLIGDLWRPELSALERDAITGMMARPPVR